MSFLATQAKREVNTLVSTIELTDTSGEVKFLVGIQWEAVNFRRKAILTAFLHCPSLYVESSTTSYLLYFWIHL